MKIKLILFLLFLSFLSFGANPIKVMLLTGQTDKYHNWQVTSSQLKAILDHQEIFQTDVVLFPTTGEALDQFLPDFSKYKVVVLDLNIIEWPEKVKRAFEKYMQNGGGMVILHEANNACSNWKAYNLMTGLGGWGGRNEKSGPYYYWKDGQYVTDNTAGSGGAHGQRVPFVINVRDSEHPITKGLPSKWLHQNDELYGNLRGPAQIFMCWQLHSPPKKQEERVRKSQSCSQLPMGRAGSIIVFWDIPVQTSTIRLRMLVFRSHFRVELNGQPLVM